MINAQFYEDKGHKLLGFHVNGHAGLADRGYDVACAAVSSAVMMTCNTATEVFKINAKVQADENDIMLKILSDEEGSGDKLVAGLMIQLDLISREYPGTINISVNRR